MREQEAGWVGGKEGMGVLCLGAGTAAHRSVSGGWRSDWKRHEWRWREERGSRNQEEGGSMHMSMPHKPLTPTHTLVVGGRSACRFLAVPQEITADRHLLRWRDNSLVSTPCPGPISPTPSSGKSSSLCSRAGWTARLSFHRQL